MRISGIEIPTTAMWILFFFFAVYLIYRLIRSAIWSFQSSLLGHFLYFLTHLFRQEMKEEDLDFKEYDVKEEIKKIDRDFEEDYFLSMVEDVFRNYCDAFSNNDSRILKAFETDTLFQRHHSQIKNNLAARRKEMHIIQNYLGAKILRFQAETKNQILVEVRANLCLYKVNQRGDLISGSMTDSRKLVYHLKFTKIGEKRQKKDSINCPNCGAPHLVHSAGICQYCGSMIQVQKDNWLLADINRF